MLEVLSEVVPFKIPGRFSPVVSEASEKLAHSRNKYFAGLGSAMRMFMPILMEPAKADQWLHSLMKVLEMRSNWTAAMRYMKVS
jgi:hypothetical protein